MLKMFHQAKDVSSAFAVPCLAAVLLLAACSGDEAPSAADTKGVVDPKTVWTTDFESAMATAAVEGKDLFLEFTGSDWCAPCKRFDLEILSQPRFIRAATENFVLVKLDFPRDRSLIDPETMAQNEALFEKYRIEGYPSVVLTDASGVPYATADDYHVGLDAYLVLLEEALEMRARRDAAMEAARSLSGLDKAKALHEALMLSGLDFSLLADFHGDVIESIRANDPDDKTGIAKRIMARERLESFFGRINDLAATGDFDAILPAIDEVMTFDGFEPSDIQQIILMRAITLGELNRLDDAIAALDEAIAVWPEAEIIANIEALREDLVLERDALADDE